MTSIDWLQIKKFQLNYSKIINWPCWVYNKSYYIIISPKTCELYLLYISKIYNELCTCIYACFFYPYLRTCLLILERGEEKERVGKRNINLLPLVCSPTGDWTQHLGRCPDQELNTWPFGLWIMLCSNCSNQLSHTGQGCILFFCPQRALC